MSRRTSLGMATIRQLCRAFTISRQAFYAARKPLKPRDAKVARRPAQGRGCTPVGVLEPRVRQIVEQHKAWGVRKVWATLRREGLRVSHKRVWALMRLWGLTLPPCAEREGPAIRGHVAVPESNRRWGTDLTTTWTRQDGVVAIVPVIDCGDRFAFACDVTKSQEAPFVLEPVRCALRDVFGGGVEAVADGLELRTDHGPQYTGADCEALAETWRLEHTLAPIGRPTGNAVTERFIETLKVELIWTRDWESAEELRRAIRLWLDLYNHERPHQSLGWMTPAEKRAENLGMQQRAVA
jgi:putative transposase